MAGKIKVEVLGETSGLSRAMRSATADVEGFGRKAGSALGSIAKAGAFAAVTAGVIGVGAVLKAGTGEWEQQAKVAATTRAELAATGGVANVTSGQISDLATAIMQKTGIDDEAVQSSENLLLAFTNVRNEAGKGNDVFNQATQAAIDLSSAGFGSMTSTSKALGKALQDPIKGLGGLAKAGIKFSDSEKKSFAAMVESGHILDAQQTILGKVQGRVGGVADAYGKTLPGQINVAKEQFNNLSGAIIGTVAPSFAKGLTAVNNFLDSFQNADGAAAKFKVVGNTIKDAAIGAADGIRSAFNAIDWPAVGTTMVAGVAAAIAAVQAFINGVDWNAVVGDVQRVGSSFATRVQASITTAFDAVDWTSVGTKVIDGITTAIHQTGELAKSLASTFMDAIRAVDWNQAGRVMGPGVAAAVATAISTALDPAFWAKNWDLAISIGLVAFGGAFVKIGARLIGPTVARVFESAILDTAGLIERLSPRLAAAFLSGMLKLPGLVGGVLSRLGGLISAGFGKLGKLSQLVVKVIGLDVAVQAIAGFVSSAAAKFAQFAAAVEAAVKAAIRWISSIPGQVKAAFAGAPGWLIGAGQAVISGFISGITSRLGDLKNTLTGIAGKVTSWKGPPAKDAVMLFPAGQLVMQGFIRGIDSKTSDLRSLLQGKSRLLLGEVNRLQASIDVVNARREREDLASAVRDSAAALAEARKKGEGVAAAEQAYQRAREDVVMAARQRALTADQAQYDKAQTAFQNAQEKLKATQQKALDVMNAALDKAKTRAAASMNRLSDLIQRGFDAANDAWVSPAQQAINAITDRRSQEDLSEAVRDAKARLADALEGGDPEAISDAQRTLARAVEDVQLASLQRQAQQQQTAHDQAMQALQDQFDKQIALTGGSMDKILKVIATYDGGFAAAGRNLGAAFAGELRAAMNDAIADAAAVKASLGNSPARAISDMLRGAISGIPSFDTGGPVTRTGLAFVHQGETVIPSGGKAAGGGGVTFAPGSIVVNGLVGNAQEVAQAIVDTINRENRVGRLILTG